MRNPYNIPTSSSPLLQVLVYPGSNAVWQAGCYADPIGEDRILRGSISSLFCRGARLGADCHEWMNYETRVQKMQKRKSNIGSDLNRFPKTFYVAQRRGTEEAFIFAAKVCSIIVSDAVTSSRHIQPFT